MDLYSAFIVVPNTQNAQVWITQCYLQITPYLPLPRKRSPDGASPDWGCGHLIAAYYSFIYPEKMRDWIGLVGWPTANGLPTLVVTRQLQVERRTVKLPVKDRRSTIVPRNQPTNIIHVYKLSDAVLLWLAYTQRWSGRSSMFNQRVWAQQWSLL